MSPHNSPDNEVLLSASSSFEDLTEYALAGNRAGMASALKAYEDRSTEVGKVLSARARHIMESLVSRILNANERGDTQSVALQAVEAYRTLIESLDPQGLAVPVQVSLLDYTGFKLEVVLHAKTPDWPAVQQTVEEARKLWAFLESHVTDKGLRDAVSTMIAGMSKAATARNAEMAVFAAQMDLALVDLLEKYFQRPAK